MPGNWATLVNGDCILRILTIPKHLIITLALALSVTACATEPQGSSMQPAGEQSSQQGQDQVQPVQSEQLTEVQGVEKPELILDLGGDPECACEPQAPQPSAQLSTLEQGFAALAQRQYVEAVQLFQKHRRQEDNPTARWESGIAIAYTSMLSNSPLYDAEAARKSYRRLRKQLKPEMSPHQQTLLMSDGLETFVVQDRHIADLQITNATLKSDLEKREEAIKRLRELTLGSKGS